MDYSWQFFRAGSVDQAAILTGADIAHLGALDQKLWVALACPTRGIEFDPRTLDLIDTDGDGRIRPPELIAACTWACAQLRDADELIRGGDTLELSAIDDSTELGAEIGAEARRTLALVEKADARVIALEDVSARSAMIAAMRFNGDGVITANTAQDVATQQVIQHIIDTQGGVKDLNGEDGINREKADAFFAAATALRDWHALIAGDEAIAPLGEGTAAAAEALAAVRAKIDDFFARCRLAAYDSTAIEELNPSQEQYREIAAQTLSLKSDAIAGLPLAPAGAAALLPLQGEGVNPAWAQALASLRVAALPDAAAGAATLSEDQWLALQARLAPYQKWLATRPATSLDSLSLSEVNEIAASQAQEDVNSLLEQDLSVGPQNARIVDLEKLLRFKRDLLRLLNNFVSFKEFYRREGAIFEAGTLYLDGRSCDLTIQVSDVARHATLAGMAKACLAYCECRRPNGAKMTIVAAFTAGDTDFLFVGRNGIFYDRHGDDWDATIVKMIENPTNVRQAFLSPYKKLIRALEEQVAKRAAASDAGVSSTLGAATSGLIAGTPGAAAAKTPSKIDVGTVAALGVALGSISAVMVGLFGKFVDLGWWIPVALLGIILAISGPSMAIAWLKLRERSLGPILDASGWAINSRLKVNVRLGRLISQMAHIPLSAKHPLKDPYADSNGGRYAAVVAVLVVLVVFGVWRMGWADGWVPAPARYGAIAARLAPRTAGAPAPLKTP